MTRQNLCIHKNDAMNFYDRIFKRNAILNSRKFKIPNNICKVYSKAHDNMTFKMQLINRISKMEYKGTDKIKLDRVGQGAGNRGTK